MQWEYFITQIVIFNTDACFSCSLSLHNNKVQRRLKTWSFCCSIYLLILLKTGKGTQFLIPFCLKYHPLQRHVRLMSRSINLLFTIPKFDYKMKANKTGRAHQFPTTVVASSEINSCHQEAEPGINLCDLNKLAICRLWGWLPLLDAVLRDTGLMKASLDLINFKMTLLIIEFLHLFILPLVEVFIIPKS